MSEDVKHFDAQKPVIGSLIKEVEVDGKKKKRFELLFRQSYWRKEPRDLIET